MDFKTLLSNGATLAPEVLLTPDGVKRGMAVKFDGSRIVGLGPMADFPEATLLPGRAIVPGMVDAHTHVGQIFGKAFSHIFRGQKIQCTVLLGRRNTV